MPSRSSRTLLLFAATVLVARSQTVKKEKSALYAANGPELTTYLLDVDAAQLAKQASVTLPDNVQEAWHHPSRRFLYVTWSNNQGGASGHHGVTAFRINPATGGLEQHGKPLSLAARSVFMTVDTAGKHLIVAYNLPSGVTIHRIGADGSLGGPVAQPAGLDFGVYAHQVRVDSSGRMVVVVTRGNGPTAAKPEDPGALKVFRYKDGLLSNHASIAPGGGYNFQPRHIEFHPTRPFAFLTLERQNQLQVYRLVDGPSLSAAPLFTAETLKDRSRFQSQATSAIHIHPEGRFLYLGNRYSGTTQFQGKRVLDGGENSIAVYSINQQTGEPTLIQNADTRGVHPRTFAIDPSGRILVVANMQQMHIRENDAVRLQQAALAVFRIEATGKLDFVRKYDQEPVNRNLFWTGIVGLP